MKSLSSIRRVAVVLIGAAVPAFAQQAAPQRTVLLAFNPLGIAWDIFQIEGELALAPGMTLGGLASHVDLDGDQYTSFEAKARYYPTERMFDGFSIGLGVGHTRFSSVVFTFNGTTSTEQRESLSAPTIGVSGDYNWIPGASRRFVVGVGLGAKRIIASSEDRSRLGLDRAHVTGRLVIGMTF